MLGPPAPAATPRVVARVEWDRGHDEFVGVMYLDEPEGIVVARTHDYWPQAGCLWIRRSEVLSLRELDEADPEVRVLNELGVRLFALDPEITELATLLGHAVDTPSPVAVYSESTGSDEVLVGLVTHVGETGCTLSDVGPDGSLSGEDLTFDLAEIIAVEWSTDYLNALSILLAT